MRLQSLTGWKKLCVGDKWINKDSEEGFSLHSSPYVFFPPFKSTPTTVSRETNPAESHLHHQETRAFYDTYLWQMAQVWQVVGVPLGPGRRTLCVSECVCVCQRERERERALLQVAARSPHFSVLQRLHQLLAACTNRAGAWKAFCTPRCFPAVHVVSPLAVRERSDEDEVLFTCAPFLTFCLVFEWSQAVVSELCLLLLQVCMAAAPPVLPSCGDTSRCLAVVR